MAKTRFIITVISVLALLLAGERAFASVPKPEDRYAFRHLRTDNSGLSYNSVMAITQDSNFSIESLAHILSLSRSTLIRKMKGLPGDYMRERRTRTESNDKQI